MSRPRFPAAAIPVALLLALLAAPVRAERRTVDLESAKEVNLEILFGAGELRILPGAPGGKVEVELRHASGAEEAAIEYAHEGRVGNLRLSCGDEDARAFLEDENFKITFDSDRDRRSGRDGAKAEGEEPPHEWEISLPADVSFSILIATGASENEIDLSGVRVRHLELKAGAGEVALRFDRPNPVPGGTLHIDTAVSKLEATGLGNGGFRKVRFNGGLGDYRLDFGGRQTQDVLAEVKMGLGKLHLRLPRSLGLKVDCSERALTGLEVDGLRRRGDLLVSDNAESADHQMVMELASGLGLVTVEVGE